MCSSNLRLIVFVLCIVYGFVSCFIPWAALFFWFCITIEQPCIIVRTYFVSATSSDSISDWEFLWSQSIPAHVHYCTVNAIILHRLILICIVCLYSTSPAWLVLMRQCFQVFVVDAVMADLQNPYFLAFSQTTSVILATFLDAYRQRRDLSRLSRNCLSFIWSPILSVLYSFHKLSALKMNVKVA